MWDEEAKPFKIFIQSRETKERDRLSNAHSLIAAIDIGDAYVARFGLSHKEELVIDGPDYKSWVNQGLGWSKL